MPFQTQLNTIGYQSLTFTPDETLVLPHVIAQIEQRFTTTKQTLSNHNNADILLGVLTESWQLYQAQLRDHKDSIVAMKSTLDTHMGEDKYRNDMLLEWQCLSKIWLLVQGFCNIEYSLANDYANDVVSLSSEFNAFENEPYRRSLLSCYYLGKSQQPTVSWREKIKSLFSR